jgi:hypothetical protein
MAGRKQSDRATRSEVVAIHARLSEALTKLDGGLVAYNGDASDQSIARDLGVSPSSVSTLRVEMFGRLFLRSAAAAAPADDPRVDELVRINENIVAAYNDLRDRHNKLIDLLSLNRVVDCRHLKVAG